jgi:sulfatase modifying factor 1
MKIFVSYSRRDLEAVDRLGGRLEAAGHSVWIDRKDMAGGDQWRLQIVEAIESADAFLVALSPRAAQSVNVRKELDLAESAGVKVIPLIIEPVTIPPQMKYQLAGLQRVNLAEDYESQFESLLSTLGLPQRPRETSKAAERIGMSQRIEASGAVLPTAESKIWEKDGKEMVRVPAGNFLYGEESVRLYLAEYWIDKTPVTNSEYARFVAETSRKAPKHWGGPMPIKEIVDHPVVEVSPDDAAAYADWAGKRLPTELEWEKAARGDDGRTYPWGNQNPTDELCNYGHTGSHTTPVGRYSPQGDSPYGCVDMSGNVWEWTDSWFDHDRQYRALRGGAFDMDENSMRAVSRHYYLWETYYSVGFRLAKDGTNPAS